MTVSTRPYFSWSGSGIDSTVPPYNSCSPNLVSIQAYISRHWGCDSLGCHVPPPASTHSHPYGAANDLRIRGANRFDRLATLEAIDFLIAYSAELGVNTIHDYFDHQRMWKPLVGWTYNAPIGSPGATHIHIETTPEAFGDGRPVEDKLPGSQQGEDPMTPEDKAYLDGKFAAIWNTVIPGHYGAPATQAEERLTAARVDAGGANSQSTNANLKLDKLATDVANLKKDVAALKDISAQILAALNGAEFPVTGTVHIGTT